MHLRAQGYAAGPSDRRVGLLEASRRTTGRSKLPLSCNHYLDDDFNLDQYDDVLDAG